MARKEDQVTNYTDKVELRFSLTEKEYVSAVRFYLLRSGEMMARIILLFLCFAGGLFVLNVLLDFLLPLWSVVALIVLVGMAWFHAYLIDLPRRYFRNEPKFRDEYSLTFTDAGIEFRTKNISSSIAWNLYTGVVENESAYVLIYGKNLPSLSILPKRAFRDGKEEATFREMLRRHIDQKFELGDGGNEYQVPSQPPDWR